MIIILILYYLINNFLKFESENLLNKINVENLKLTPKINFQIRKLLFFHQKKLGIFFSFKNNGKAKHDMDGWMMDGGSGTRGGSQIATIKFKSRLRKSQRVVVGLEVGTKEPQKQNHFTVLFYFPSSLSHILLISLNGFLISVPVAVLLLAFLPQPQPQTLPT